MAKRTETTDPMAAFSERTRRWFEASFEAPTPAQAAGWPKIASGANTLICAPTGSGKTLSAFLWGIDSLARRATNPGARGSEAEQAPGLGTGVRIVYVSPLKALSYDVERNLRAPLTGTGAEVSVGLRTGDTPQRERQAMRRTPPDILITTPESLYLMVTSQVREILTGVEAVIVDEIHAVAQSKRGSHLALTLERLSKLAIDEGNDDPQRIGLSATQRPLERIAGFLVGPKRKCEIVNAGVRKDLDLEIVVPVADMADPLADPVPAPDPAAPGSGAEEAGGTLGKPLDPVGEPGSSPRSIWPAIYPELLRLVLEHTSTIIFVNNRRGAERLAKRLNELHNNNTTTPELPATEHAGNAPSASATTGNNGEDPTEAPRAGGASGEAPRPKGAVGPPPRQDPPAGAPANTPSRKSPAPTTARSPTRSAWWSRSCSSRASSPASSPPPRSSSGSTWAPSTW